jgi:CheY-like chemotaxis protein
MPPVRVLVVDDNHLIRRLLDLVLEGAGYASVEADSGEAALAIVLSDPPDVCVVDEAMPGMSGSELIRLLRGSSDRRLAEMPVIGISGRAGANVELLAAGATEFLPKPIEERPLLAAIDRVLDGPRRSHRLPRSMPAA